MSVLYLHWDYQKSIQKSAVHFLEQEVKQKYYFCIETISIYITLQCLLTYCLLNAMTKKAGETWWWRLQSKHTLKRFGHINFHECLCMVYGSFFSQKRHKKDRASHVTPSPIFIPSIRDRVLSTKNQSSKR